MEDEEMDDDDDDDDDDDEDEEAEENLKTLKKMTPASKSILVNSSLVKNFPKTSRARHPQSLRLPLK